MYELKIRDKIRRKEREKFKGNILGLFFLKLGLRNLEKKNRLETNKIYLSQ